MGSYIISQSSVATLVFGMDQAAVPEGEDLLDTHGGKSTDPGAINVLDGSIESLFVSGSTSNPGGNDTIGITIRTINDGGATVETKSFDVGPKSGETFRLDIAPIDVQPGWYIHVSTSASSEGGTATIDNPRVTLAIQGVL